MLIGGVARRVAQELPCAIVTVRSQSPISLSIDGEVPPVKAAFCASHPSGANCDRFQHGDELLRQGQTPSIQATSVAERSIKSSVRPANMTVLVRWKNC
jgi:hypothetical protein